MSGLIQSIFQNFRKFPKLIAMNILVVGAGGGGAGGTYYGDGRGGNAGYGATVYNTGNVIVTDSTYTVTVAGGTGGGSITWNGSSWVVTPGGTGGASYISGNFRWNAGLSAPGGSGTSGIAGGSGGAGLSTYNSTPFVYNNITGDTVYYSGGAAGGGAAVYLGGTGAGAPGSAPGQGGGGGGGAGTSFGYTGLGGNGGGGAAGVVIMRCERNAYTAYTTTGNSPTVTPLTIDNIVHSVFKWTTSGSITFTKT